MVKSVLGVAHQGLRDWIIQRFTAIIMAVYVIGLFYFLMTNSGLTYGDWQHAFTYTWVKVATILFVLSIAMHAWTGMWTVLTDYVKPFVLRCLLNAIILLSLVACVIWAVTLLWSV